MDEAKRLLEQSKGHVREAIKAAEKERRETK